MTSIVRDDVKKEKRRVMMLLLLTRSTRVILSLSRLACRQTISLFVVVDVYVLEQTDTGMCAYKDERKTPCHLACSFLSLPPAFYTIFSRVQYKYG